MTLSVNIPEGLPSRVNGDMNRLRQVVLNLLANAVKFTQVGQIRLLADWREDADGEVVYRIEVHDTGIGISPDAQEKIFDAFEQADGSTTRKYGGTGLGLSICGKLVRLMGGAIHVDSAVDEGSCFWFEVALPSAKQPVGADNDAAGPDSDSTVEAGRRPPPRAARILIAEDNAVNREVATLMLEELGHSVDVCENGAEAHSLFSRETYDLILMDCHMPEVDGFAATRWIRRHERHAGDAKRVPIVALTANVEKGTRDACISAGMDDYMSKPFGFQELSEIVGRWLPQVVAGPPVAEPLVDVATQGDVLDASALAALAHLQRPGRPNVVLKVVSLYLKNAPLLVEELHQGITGNDAKQIRMAAHSLKSSSANLGARELAEQCQQIERLAKDENLATMPECLDRLENLFAEVVLALNAVQQHDTNTATEVLGA